MSALDSLLLILLLWGAYSGFRKGFVMEIFSIGSFFLATIGSIRLLNKFTSLCTRWYGSVGGLMPYLVFVLLFIIIVLAITLVGRLFRRLINLTLLGGIDKLVGALLGMFKWAFFVSTFLWLASLLHLKIPAAYTAHSFLFPIIEPLAPRFMGWLPILQQWLQSINTAGGN